MSSQVIGAIPKAYRIKSERPRRILMRGSLQQAELAAEELQALASSTDSKDAEKAGELLRAIANEALTGEVMRTD